MKISLKFPLLILIYFGFSTICFSQKITVSAKDIVKSDSELATASSSSKLCFSSEVKKPILKPIKFKTKVNGKKILMSDCCPIQVFTINRPKVIYPPAAKAVRAQGNVSVKVYVNEEGKVFWGKVESGHILLRAVALRAACRTIFKPYICDCGKREPNQFQTTLNYTFSL